MESTSAGVSIWILVMTIQKRERSGKNIQELTKSIRCLLHSYSKARGHSWAIFLQSFGDYIFGPLWLSFIYVLNCTLVMEEIYPISYSSLVSLTSWNRNYSRDNNNHKKILMVLVYPLGHEKYWKCSLQLHMLCGEKNAKGIFTVTLGMKPQVTCSWTRRVRAFLNNQIH